MGPALYLSACAVDTDRTKFDGERERAIESLQVKSGAPVALEVNAAGTARVLALKPRFPLAAHAGDPAVVAQSFVVEHRAVFGLDASDATQFIVTNVDNDPTTGLRHVSLNRTFGNIPVFQGGISVHMDSGNNVFRVLGDDSYRIAMPSNRMMLSPVEAAQAAAKAFHVEISPVVAESDDLHTVFTSTGLLDPLKVSKRIVHVDDGDDRFAYQALVSWRDDSQQQQYWLALVDAQDGTMLASYDLVKTFTGRAFLASPGASADGDTRQLVSFDGDPAASPQGWVGPARKTIGNNAVAATDLDGNNTVGPREIQPTADANDSFDFRFDASQDAANFREAAVTSAFFLVNDFHDRTYRLGFTETAGNFQTSNFDRGGAQNDAVQVDVQDGAGTNTANFVTPPDGGRPRLQLFLFNIARGTRVRQDSAFDPTVVYHESTHGLSNRLVGGGSTACLRGLQSGGMDEGWGDFLAGSFLNDPVIGAYVTGDAVRGVRSAPMNNSPLTYADIKSMGVIALPDLEKAGEVWAATLWSARTAVGKNTIEQLVVSAMKDTPCNPTMLEARDSIIAADERLNDGDHVCPLWRAFASRQMGCGASSPNHNSTSAIVLSTAVPPECEGTGAGHKFSAMNLPLAIPDAEATGVNALIDVPAGLADTLWVTVDVNITHTFRGNLVIQVVAPGGQTATLSNREGEAASSFVVTGQDLTRSFPGVAPTGQWRLFVRDLAAGDVGTINTFNLHITSTN